MIVMDMAGTTIDEDNIVYKTLHQTLVESDINVDFQQVLLYAAGREKKDAILDLISRFGSDRDIQNVDKIFESFKIKLEQAYNVEPLQFMQDVENVLPKIRSQNIMVVLNTGYDRNTAKQILTKIGAIQFMHYDLLITASDVTRPRPCPDMIFKAMELLQINDPKQVIKIGDSKIDIEEGKNAGCKYSIGITTGAQDRNELKLADPDFIIDNINEIYTLL